MGALAGTDTYKYWYSQPKKGHGGPEKGPGGPKKGHGAPKKGHGAAPLQMVVGERLDSIDNLKLSN